MIKKELLEKLNDESISRKEYKEITLQINERFVYIVNYLSKVLNWKIDWFDYSNEKIEEHVDGREVNKGYFDSCSYKDDIFFTGNIKQNNQFSKYNESFPTRWLYENFIKELDDEIEQFKINATKEQENRKKEQKQLQEQANKIIANIKSKLTPEELISFTFPKEDEMKKTIENMKLVNSIDKKVLNKLDSTELLFLQVASNAQRVENIKSLPKENRANLYKNNNKK